jgi:hypothetical protein
MSTWQKIAAFVVAAAAAFALAIGVGQWVGPIDGDDEDHGHADGDRVRLNPVEDASGGHDHGSHDHRAAYSLELEKSVHEAGRQELAFTIRDASGEPLTSYDVAHEKLLHLVVVRRDLGGFRHVHPTLDESTGEWTTPLDLGAGSWRIYADFTPKGGEQTVAEADLSVAGDFAPQELPPPSDTAEVDGYEVHLTRDGGELQFHVTRDGEEVDDLEPYLGAFGHLVAIRAEDLAYLHVHPEEGEAGPEVAFHADLAEAGPYRLFLEFRHGGKVHRTEFTADGGSPQSTDEPTGEPSESGGGEHGEHDH